MTTTVSPEAGSPVNRSPERFDINTLRPLLEAGLTNEQIILLEELNFEHDATKERRFSEAYNSDESDTEVPYVAFVREIDRKNYRAQREKAHAAKTFDKVKAKRNSAIRIATADATQETRDRVKNELLPLFNIETTGDAEYDADRKLDLYDALMYAATMDRVDFVGIDDEDNRRRGLYDELLESYVHNEPTPDAATAPTAPDQTQTEPQATATNVDSADTPDSPDRIPNSDPIIEQARQHLDALRDELAVVAAKEFGRAARRSSAYGKKHETYLEQMTAVGRLEEVQRAAANPDRNDTEKQSDTIAFILSEQTALREATHNHLANTKFSKFAEWFNSGGTLKRIGKGMVVGAGITTAVGTAVVLSGGAALLGTVAGAGGTGVAVGRAASGFTRGYARNEVDREVRAYGSDEEKQQLRRHLEESDNDMNAAAAYSADRFNEEREFQKNKRRKSMRAGIGGAALGIALGTTVTLAADAASDNAKFTGFVDKFRDVFGDEAPSVSAEGEIESPFNTPAPETPPTTPGGNLDQDGSGGGEVTSAPVVNPEIVSAKDFFTGSIGTTHFTEAGVESFNNWIDGHTVKTGESISSLSKQYLQEHGIANPSIYQIDSVKDHMLQEFKANGHANSKGWLMAGDIINTK